MIAGEASGDLHGSHLIRSLRSDPRIGEIRGVGGPLMENEGMASLHPFSAFQVMGFSEVIKAYPRLRKLFYNIADEILDSKPSALITIDYPGFNLRMATHLRNKGFKGKLIHYISPTVWAWGKGRIRTMEHSLDLLLTVFPFEAASFQGTRLPVRYVGNPLVETIGLKQYATEWRKEIGLPDDIPFLVLFPGSRKGEIERNLPLQLEASRLLMAQDKTLHTLISLADDKTVPSDARILRLPKQYNYEAMKECKGAIAKSGTVTLELALHGTPTAVTYPIGLLNYLAAKYLFRIRLPHYCISNILLKETLYPEWIGRGLKPEAIAASLQALWETGEFEKKADKLKMLLGPMQASKEAAKSILEQLC